MADSQQLVALNRVYVKRTRRGAVRTHVRQHYLRDDLPTGCPQLDPPELEPRLSASAQCYLVLDTNVVLHQIDLLERPALRDVIVLQTVLEEVRHNKLSVHKRLRALIADESRRFQVFSNEHHQETYTARRAGESPNDRNDRAIRVAAQWYQAQLGEAVTVLLLTNDAENRRLACEAGLKAQRVHDYVRTRSDATDLVDLLARAPDDDDGATPAGAGGAARTLGRKDAAGKGETRYAAHLPMSELRRGIEAGELHQGKLNVSRHNSSQGSVFVGTLPGHTAVLVQDRDALNRAMDGDIVAVRLVRAMRCVAA